MGKTARAWLCILLSPCFLCAADPAAQRRDKSEILISAAVSLKDVMSAVTPAFEKMNPGIRLTFNYGASGQLRIQIENGAPADVFISAATGDMDILQQKGLIYEDTRRDVAGNSLVLIRNRTVGPRFAKMEELAGNNVVRVAIGNPVTVPAGRYAKESLESANLYARLKGKLILGENVRQVLDYVARGEADAGFVYRTDAMAESRVEIVEKVPASRHRPILYPAAAVRLSGEAAAAKKFVQYLSSAEARSIFRRYGFE